MLKKGQASQSRSDGALSISALSMTMVWVFAIMEWLGQHNWNELALADKLFFTVAAIFAMARHNFVEFKVH